MQVMRWMLNLAVAGALLGVLIVSSLAPSLLTWNNTPGSGMAMCNCEQVTRDTASQLIHAQMYGCGAGAALGLILGLVIGLARRKPVIVQVKA